MVCEFVLLIIVITCNGIWSLKSEAAQTVPCAERVHASARHEERQQMLLAPLPHTSAFKAWAGQGSPHPRNPALRKLRDTLWHPTFVGPELTAEVCESSSKIPSEQGSSFLKVRGLFACSANRYRLRSACLGLTVTASCAQQLSEALKPAQNQSQTSFPTKPHVPFALRRSNLSTGWHFVTL